MWLQSYSLQSYPVHGLMCMQLADTHLMMIGNCTASEMELCGEAKPIRIMRLVLERILAMLTRMCVVMGSEET